MAKDTYKEFISRSKYVIKEGIFYIGDNREYEVVIKFVKAEEILEDNTQKLVKIFFNDLRSADIDLILKDKERIVVTLLNRKILIKKSPYCLKRLALEKNSSEEKPLSNQKKKNSKKGESK